MISKFRETGNVHGIPKSGRKAIIDDNRKLDVVLSVRDHSHKSTRLKAAENCFSDRCVARVKIIYLQNPVTRS